MTRFDPQQRDRFVSKEWAYAPEAQPLTPTLNDALYPASLSIERAQVGSKWDTVIGGTCLLFTGDMYQYKNNYDTTGIKDATKNIRLDQLTETVGMVKDAQTLYVCEDSLFAALVGVDTSLFTSQSKEIAIRMERLARLTGVADITMVLTSDIENALQEQVQLLAQLIGNPNFTQLNAAPVMLMYTQLWPELLTQLGYLDSPAVICIEPTLHFQKKQQFPMRKEQTAYLDFIEWLQTEKYGFRNSRNELFNIAGTTPCITSDQKKQRTRMLPYSAVVNTQNIEQWMNDMRSEIQSFPFPLKQSLLFGEATNYFMWDEMVRLLVLDLIAFESEYRSERKAVSNSPNARMQATLLREKTYIKVKPTLAQLSALLIKNGGYILGD